MYCVFWSSLYMLSFLYMHPLHLHSMENRMTRRLPDIAVWNIPSHTFRINACDKLNNDNLTIPLYLFANDISGENTLVLSILWNYLIYSGLRICVSRNSWFRFTKKPFPCCGKARLGWWHVPFRGAGQAFPSVRDAVSVHQKAFSGVACPNFRIFMAYDDVPQMMVCSVSVPVLRNYFVNIFYLPGCVDIHSK